MPSIEERLRQLEQEAAAQADRELKERKRLTAKLRLNFAEAEAALKDWLTKYPAEA